MSQILVFSEKDELALELLSKGVEFAGELGMELSAAILGPDAKSRATSYFARGAAKVYAAEDKLFADFDAEIQAQALFQIADMNQAETVLLASTKRGKELAPRLAQMLGAGCITDALNIEVKEGKLMVSRYALGGTTIASGYIDAPKKVIAVMPHTFEQAAAKPSEGELITVDLKLDRPKVTVAERKPKERESVDIEKADVLVCIGRGLKQKEDLALIQELANAAKGEIGCTKEMATSLEWLSEDRVIGVSGKRCNPKLVFSIGISGQSQHVAGIAGAKIIAAINNDQGAPIFRVADYGIVADLYQAVPRLISELKK